MNNLRTPVSASYWLLLLLFLSGCSTSTLSTSKKIQSDLFSTEYGKTKSEYVQRAAYVSLDTLNNGTRALNVTLYIYGRHLRSILFYDVDKETLVDAVETFLEWEETASANREMLKKRITTVKVPHSTPIYLSFHSETETSHYLTVGYLESEKKNTAEFPLLVFDRENAEKFKELLKQIPDPRK